MAVLSLKCEYKQKIQISALFITSTSTEIYPSPLGCIYKHIQIPVSDSFQFINGKWNLPACNLVQLINGHAHTIDLPKNISFETVEDEFIDIPKQDIDIPKHSLRFDMRFDTSE